MSTEHSPFAVDVGPHSSPPTRSPRKRLPWRSSLVTIVLAGLAAFVGARLGSHPSPPRSMPLSEHLFELLGDVELSGQQRETILSIGQKYAPERERLRLQSRLINANLLRTMAQEQRFGPGTAATLAQLHVVMGERLKLSLEYTLQVREVLTPEQRAFFDRRVVEEAAVAR